MIDTGEIQEATQILRVSFEGIEIMMKILGGGIHTAKDIGKFFGKLMEMERLSGRTSVKDLLKTGGDLQVFQFDTNDMAQVKKLANQYKLRYALLPDINKEDGKSEILFHSDAVPRVNQIIANMKGGRIKSVQDYLDNGEEKELKDTYGIEKQEKEMPNGEIAPKEQPISAFGFRAVGTYLAESPGISIGEISNDLDMPWKEVEPVIKHMEKLGILEVNESGRTAFKMEKGEFSEYAKSGNWQKIEDVELMPQPEKRAAASGRTAGQMSEMNNRQNRVLQHSKNEVRDDPNVHQIFIARSLAIEETDTRIYLDSIAPDPAEEIELCRFRLQEGARLRYIYENFADCITEFDTIHLVNVPWASPDKPSLHPIILKQFAVEILKKRDKDALDSSFAINTLANKGIMTEDAVRMYIGTRIGNETGEGNEGLYYGLMEILKTRSSDSPIQKRMEGTQRQVVLL